MIYLILAAMASTLILVGFKVFGRLRIDGFTAITFNYLAGTVFGFASIGWNADIHDVMSAGWLPMSIITGFILISGFVLYSLSTRQAGMAITAISGRMAVVLTVITGILCFKESADVVKLVGILLAVIAFGLTLRNGKPEKPSARAWLLPLAVLIFMGLNDIILKVTQFYYTGSENELEQVRYISTAFFIGFLAGVPFMLIRFKSKSLTVIAKSVVSGIILGILNWLSSYFLMMGMAVMEVSVIVPLVNISVVVCSSLVGYFVFKEKLSIHNWTGIVMAVVAIVLISKGS